MGRTSSVNVGIKRLRVHPFQEPWLVDKATLQYPEHIPTLVLDVDKAQLYVKYWMISSHATRSLPTYAAASNGAHLWQVILHLQHDSKKAPGWKEPTLLDL